MPDVKEWLFDPKEILASNRKVKGIFHKSIIDKDDELITPDAIKKSIPDYMHLPALHDFHKERPVGLATRIWQEKDGSFGFEGVIKATEDCDDIWEKISKGNYDHVSIFGRRTEGNQNCSLPQGLRTGPCITNGVRLDSISVCDDNARNDSTSLSVAKAQLIWDGMDMIQKAETAESSNLMHTATDNPEKKCPCSKKKYKVIEKTGASHSGLVDGKYDDPAHKKRHESSMENRESRREKIRAEIRSEGDFEKGTLNQSPEMTKKFRAGKKMVRDYTANQDSEDASEGMKTMTSDNMRKGVKSDPIHVVSGNKKDTNDQVRHLQEGQDAVTSGGKRGELNAKYKPGMKKGDEEDDEMTDDVEKGSWEREGINETEALHKKTQRPEQRKVNEKKKKTAPEGLKLQKGEDEDEDVEKGKYEIKEEPATRGGSGQKSNADIREPGEAGYEPTPRGTKDSSGRAGTMRKGEKEQEIDTETPGEDAKEEMDDDDEEDEEQKAYSRAGRMATAHTDLKNKRLKTGQQDNDRVRHEVRADVNRKMAIKKGDTMEEQEEVSQEYVTKAMVPIEEVDTIVKARTEEISKAYIAQFDEIKKANLAAIEEIKKAYDAKFAELNTKVDKMSEETIRKGGSIVVIPQLLDPTTQTGSMSNADALARMTVGR